MRTHEAVPQALRFMEVFLSKDRRKFQTATWLRVPFEADTWIIDLNYRFNIRWSVEVGQTGHRLTTPRHSSLCEALKSWTIFLGHPDFSGGRVFSDGAIYDRIRMALVLSDYFLLNAERLGVDRLGLQAITENDLLALLGALASNRSSSESIYGWSHRLTEFLQQRIRETEPQVLSAAIQEHSLLLESIPPVEEWLTSLGAAEVVLARAWLWQNGYYYAASDGHKYQPNLHRLAEQIYGHTLAGSARKPSAIELWLGPGWTAKRELPGVDIRSLDERMGAAYLRKYKSVLHSLGALKRYGLHVPDTRVLGKSDVLKRLDLKVDGRFRTLPQRIVLKQLRNAIEFSLMRGQSICDSFIRVAVAARDAGETIAVFANARRIDHLLDPSLRDIGARGWTIEPTYAGSPMVADAPRALSHQEYYVKLRSAPGLRELLQVLYGAVQLVVGVLMARRQAELIALVAGKCLDASETRLIFECGKTGVRGHRERRLRPIPPIGVKLIKMLEAMIRELQSVGLLDKACAHKLFTPPVDRGGGAFLDKPSEWSFNKAMDDFCDYFQVETNVGGQRYYIRQHQLRRFFAVLFFWGDGFGGLDVLRWFLGHSSFEHVYNYITENTPGAMLRGVKAQWAAEAAMQGSAAVEGLAAVLEQHYSTRDFSVLEGEELAEYIERLLEERRVEIEPEFLDEGKRYKILVIVSESGKSHAA